MAFDSPVKSEKVVTLGKEIMCANGCKRLPVISRGAKNKLLEEMGPLTLCIFTSFGKQTVDLVHYHIYSINEFWSINKYLVYKGMTTNSNKENSFSHQ